MSEVREGYKMTELGEIPSNWEVKQLSDVLTVGYGKNQKDVEVPKSEIPILGTGGIIGWSNRALFDKPSVLIGRKGTIDKPRFIDIPFWTIDTLFYTDIDFERVSPKFIYYLFQTIDWYKYNEATGVPSLSASNISKIIFAYPILEEQQKIAAILSTVDEKINETERLIVKTKELKKGLIQQLLTKGIGHTEFKQTELGEMPLDWYICELQEISDLITKGTSPSTYNFDFEDDGVNFIRSENILKSNKLDVSDLVKVSEECHNKLARSQIEADDILISIAGMFLGKIGSVPKDIVPANTNQAVAIVRLKEKNLNKYIYYYLQSTDIRNIIENIATAGAQPNLNLKQVGSFKIKLPPLEEQQKIVSILSTVDEQIEVYEQEKAKYEELKKGLMQQLLTGQIRVKI